MLLNNSNWLEYALNNYDTDLNLKCEIYDDLKFINTIKKSILLYQSGDDVQLRMIINGIVLLTNVFGINCSFNLLLFKLNENTYSIIKTCYYYLKYISKEINNNDIYVDYNINDVEIDRNLLQKLITNI